MPELNETKHDLIDVGEENGAEINFDDNNGESIMNLWYSKI